MIKSSDHNHLSIHTLYKLKRGPPKTIPHHLAALVRLVRFWGEPLSLESIYRLCVLEWVYYSVPECTRVYKTLLGCNKICQSVLGCTKVNQSVPG